MIEKEGDWPNHKPKEKHLHPGIIEERVKHPDEIREQERGWEHRGVPKPREPDMGLRLSVGCIVIFFVAALVIGIIKLIQ